MPCAGVSAGVRSLLKKPAAASERVAEGLRSTSVRPRPPPSTTANPPLPALLPAPPLPLVSPSSALLSVCNPMRLSPKSQMRRRP